MALNNILPQYQAEERSAQVNVHPVPMPNHMDLAGRMLSQAGNDIQKATFGLALDMKRRKDALDAKEDDLAVTQAVNGFTDELTKFMAEQSHKFGSDAEGNTKRLEDWWGKATRKWGANLSLNGSRAFNNHLGQMHPTYWKATYNHEWEQMTTANVQAKETMLDNEVSAVAMHGGTLNRVEGLAKEVFVARYGSLDEESPMWKNYRQNVIDKSVSACVEYRVNQGNIDRAVEFYNDNQGKLSEVAREKLQGVLGKVQRNEISLQSANVLLGNINAKVGDKSLGGRYNSEERQLAYAQEVQRLSNSTDPNDKLTLQYLQQAYEANSAVKAANLTTDLAERTSMLLTDDSTNSLLRNIKLLDIELPTLPDSLLKDKLQTMRDKMVEEQERRFLQQQRENKAETAEAKAEANEQARIEQARYNEWKSSYYRQATAGVFKAFAARSDHKVALRIPDDHGFEAEQSFDLSNEKERNLFFMLMDWGSSRADKCLTEDDKRTITAIATGKIKSNEYEQARSDVAKKLQSLYPGKKAQWTVDAVSVIMPELVDEYLSYRAVISAGGKNSTSAIQEACNAWLTKKFVEKRDVLGDNWRESWWAWPIGWATDDRYQDFEEFFSDAIGSDGKANPAKTYRAWLALHREGEPESESDFENDGYRYGAFDRTFGGR